MIAIASDHGGYPLKEHIKAYLAAKGITCQDFGTDSTESCDYPAFGKAAAQAVASGQCQWGIVICTTGIGISITANKVRASAAPCAATLCPPPSPGGTTTPTCWPWVPASWVKTWLRISWTPS